MNEAIVIAIALIVLLAIGIMLGDDVPRAYRNRACLGSAWRLRFPSASKTEIRHFLHLFAASFALRPKHALKFGPDDELMSIYRARYPLKGWPDALELESLAKEVEKNHGVRVGEIWHEQLTLGELFERILESKKSMHATCEDARA